MFSYCALDAAEKVTSFRVADITIGRSIFEIGCGTDALTVLRGVLDHCVVPAEQRARADFGTDNDVPGALVKFDVELVWGNANASTLGALTTHYPALVRSLQVVKIGNNTYDDSGAALGAFAALATRLQDITFVSCGLTSLQGLQGHCECLQKVNLQFGDRLSSLDGLGDRVYLQEVNASDTSITSIEPLRSCPSMTKVVLVGCHQLASIEGLEYHQYLHEVVLTLTGITSIEPLRTCPALTKLDINGCRELTSIDALAGHQWLQEVYASRTAIASIDSLYSCPALTTVNLSGCNQLSSIDALADHQRLQEVSAAYAGIASIESLRTCPALTKVDVSGCQELTSIDALADHQWLQVVDASSTAITSIEPLRTCLALTTVNVNHCQELPAIDVDFLPASMAVVRFW